MNSQNHKIELKVIYRNDTKCRIPKKLVESVILDVLNKHNKSGKFEIGVLFTNQQNVKELNKKYRNKNSATTVLSFPLYDNILLGDIVICPELAGDNIESLIKHSTLHLLGIHHK